MCVHRLVRNPFMLRMSHVNVITHSYKQQIGIPKGPGLFKFSILLQSNTKVILYLYESTGIIYIDEVDKLARKNGGIEGSRDVGGEGVQQALLRMMEGSMITIQAKAVNIEGSVNHDNRPKVGVRSSNTGRKRE